MHNNCGYTINHSNVTHSRPGNVWVGAFAYHPEGCENDKKIVLDEFPEY